MRRPYLTVLFTALASTADAQGSSLLVTPQQLNAELRDPRLVLLHVGPPEDYAAGHIAGARFVDLLDIAQPPNRSALALELPDDTTLKHSLEKYGIGDDSKVVVAFGADWVSPSTRLVWTLQAAGLGAQTRFLDGGTRAWKRAGLPVTTVQPEAARPGRLTRSMDQSVIADHRFIQAHENATDVRLVDARTPMFFEGPAREMQGRRIEPGHIAGAKNLPFNSLSNDSLAFLPIEVLRQKFADAGVRPGDTIVAYCHIGQQATVVVLAARILGHPVRLYDGSMDDWQRRKLPLENATANKPPEQE